MGSSVAFYCGPSDSEALLGFAVSLGLHLVPMGVGPPEVPAPEDIPFCYLSVDPRAQLHPYGKAPQRYTDAIDPMLGFSRAYYKEPYLVLGHIHWSDDVAALAERTKPYFRKLREWIRREWKPHGDLFIGPHAQRLIAEGAQQVNALPGRITFRSVEY